MIGESGKFILDDCPIRYVLDRFGDKWSILIIVGLSNVEKLRFNELQKAIPDVSQKMLTKTLRNLEADGLVHRKIYPEVPPRVEYRLTEMGISLVPHVNSLADWANIHFKKIKTSREAYGK
ncbi:helix-turn-helix domain-containing protein [Aquimarina sp. AU474]|uniref:winged helix-turn-helix transcriptional regulator n=1 Tax=Aquimarina sp. AU474 TaxID=2108529 RepID=UPI000D69155E|nr:helix-turn-helix domain-containing protein [Aquimarina sp. AU474]